MFPKPYCPMPHHCFYEVEKDRYIDLFHRRSEELEAKESECAKQRVRLQSLSQYTHDLVKRHNEEMQELRKRLPALLEAPPAKKMRPLVPDRTKTDAFLKERFATLRSLTDICALQSIRDPELYLYNSKFKALHASIDAVKRLDAMIGLKDVKDSIFELICYYSQTKPSTDLDHIVIFGSPGVGKSELAERLAKVLLPLRFPQGKFVRAQRKDLIGSYLGMTAPKTQAVIDEAVNGILFIDEAYSLGNDGSKQDLYSKECLDTLNENLTLKKGQMLVMIAGYEEELNACFFAANPGLASRFPETNRIRMKPYDANDLHAIFRSQVKDENWILDAPEPATLALFTKHYEKFKACARDVQNLFKDAKKLAARRCMQSALCLDATPTLMLEDVQKAMERWLGVQQPVNPEPCFMYL